MDGPDISLMYYFRGAFHDAENHRQWRLDSPGVCPGAAEEIFCSAVYGMQDHVLRIFLRER